MAIDNRPTDLYSSRSGVLVAPNDTTDLARASRRILATADGIVAVILLDDDDTNILLLPVKAGVPLSVRARRILATGTTVVGSIFALY